MGLNNEELLVELKRQISAKVLGHENARMEFAAVTRIHHDTGLGMRTLKRLFGLERPPPNYFPFLGTRDVLARYGGYSGWAGWVQASTELALKVEKDSLKNPDGEEIKAAEETIAVPLLSKYPLPTGIGYPNTPFRNLNWFRRQDARIFFGRGKEIEQVLDYLHTPHRDEWICVYGQSGVGKSSFLHAGILPRLESYGRVKYVRYHRGDRLVDLAMEFWEVEGEEGVLILDQIEGVFMNGVASGWEEIRAVIDIWGQKRVANAKGPTCILSFRKEHFAEIDSVFNYLEVNYTRFFLRPLDANGIEEAITGLTLSESSVQKYQLTIEPSVPETILDLIAGDTESHIAPTLQIILTHLWEKATRDGKWPPFFSLDLVREHIKVRSHFLGDFIDESIEFVHETHSDWVKSGLVWSVLAFYISGRDTAGQRSMDELQKEFAHIRGIVLLIKMLQDRYMLTEPLEIGVGELRLAHDALGPLIRIRFNRSQAPGQIAYRLLENRSVVLGEEKEAGLLDEATLKRIEAGREGMRDLNDLEADLVNRSRLFIEKSNRNKRLRRTIEVAGAILLIGSVFLLIRLGTLNQEANEDLSRQMVTEAGNLLEQEVPEATEALNLINDVIKLGIDADEAYSLSLGFSRKFIFSHGPESILPYYKIIDQLPENDLRRGQFFTECTFVHWLARDYEQVAIDLEYADPKGGRLNLSGLDERTRKIACKRSFKIRLGTGNWDQLMARYYPRLIAVPPPDPKKVYPANISQLIQDTFWIAETEVTNLQLVVFLNLAKFSEEITDDQAKLEIERISRYSPDLINLGGRWAVKKGKEDYPANARSIWIDQYCDFMGLELPSAPEWEYAARGGPASEGFLYAGSDSLDLIANYRTIGEEDPQMEPVKQYRPNSLGLYDMNGNLRELIAWDSIDGPPESWDQRGRRTKGGGYRDFLHLKEYRVSETSDTGNMGFYLNSLGFRPILRKRD